MTYISVVRLGSFPSLSHPAVLAGLATLAIATFTPVPSSAAPATVIVKASFLRTNGAQPKGAITAAGDGHYYGTTSSGGANNVGAIFEFDPAGNNGGGSISLKASFDRTIGSPFADLKAAGNGRYYGSAVLGANGDGVIYEFNPGLACP